MCFRFVRAGSETAVPPGRQEHEQADERPAATELRHAIGDALAERRLPVERLVRIAGGRAVFEEMAEDAALELSQFAQPGLEIAEDRR